MGVFSVITGVLFSLYSHKLYSKINIYAFSKYLVLLSILAHIFCFITLVIKNKVVGWILVGACFFGISDCFLTNHIFMILKKDFSMDIGIMTAVFRMIMGFSVCIIFGLNMALMENIEYISYIVFLC